MNSVENTDEYVDCVKYYVTQTCESFQILLMMIYDSSELILTDVLDVWVRKLGRNPPIYRLTVTGTTEDISTYTNAVVRELGAQLEVVETLKVTNDKVQGIFKKEEPNKYVYEVKSTDPQTIRSKMALGKELLMSNPHLEAHEKLHYLIGQNSDLRGEGELSVEQIYAQ